ncbi:hypothetical protein C479_05238 [Halovivax asiaticus JCM 14624]|uniref:TRAM domain-containing protein n=1 Tax=Halovivax asiaticus JCM 14624 TaxID=1227490 RepID=M0BMU7_9EURY|nr:hypothetical protein [Halovivax asiaticus]ELZ12185.1 hypothetical protein C479_05238 [Halovivax asiaticus JCM 14624]
MDEGVATVREVVGAGIEAALEQPMIAGGVIGAVVLVIVGFVAIRRLRRWWRVRRDVRRSRTSHERAQNREPPVSVGEEYTVGVQEFSHHHSGERHAVAKVEGFVVFVTDVPSDVDPADTIRISILSFNRGKTSATARFLGRA